VKRYQARTRQCTLLSAERTRYPGEKQKSEMAEAVSCSGSWTVVRIGARRQVRLVRHKADAAAGLDLVYRL